MKDNILVQSYYLNFILRRLEKLTYEDKNYEVEQQIKIINEKIYEISDAIEMIEVIIDDELL